jgi:precorrin-2 dehydrogenase/sirohydrochlorin ferrochelatase
VRYYPAFLDLRDRGAVIVGGGKVAERKVRSLLKTGISVKVISPTLTSYLEKIKKERGIVHVKRNYRKGDLKNIFIVIAATSSITVNKKVAADAEFLVNVVHPPDAGNFIVPSHVNRGSMTIAVSTEGASPAIARSIRTDVEKRYGKEFGQYLRFVEKIRKKAVLTIPDRKRREKFLKSLADERLFQRIRKKGFSSVSREILSTLDKIIKNY